MVKERCGCEGEDECLICGARQYWCDSCKQAVPEKRCPLCGLKTGKMPQKSQN